MTVAETVDTVRSPGVDASGGEVVTPAPPLPTTRHLLIEIDDKISRVFAINEDERDPPSDLEDKIRQLIESGEAS